MTQPPRIFATQPAGRQSAGAGRWHHRHLGVRPGWLAHLLAAIWLLVGAAPVQVAATDSIRLRSGSSAAGPQVKLADVADLAGAEALSHAAAIVGRFADGQDQMTIRLADLRQQLTQRRANWARLALAGYARCQVTRRLRDADGGNLEGSPPQSAVANGPPAIHGPPATTLGERTILSIANFVSIEPAVLQVTFPGIAKATLAQAAGQGQFTFEPVGRPRLGRIPIVIRQIEKGRPVKTLRITADVARRGLAVVTRRPVERGRLIQPDDVELKPVTLRRAGALQRIDEAVGRRARSVLRRGVVISPDDLQSPRLVRRGQLLDVHCRVGTLLIRTVARAIEDGSRGELISVRNPRSRKTYTIRVSGPAEATLDLNGGSTAVLVPPEGGAPTRKGDAQ